MRFLFLLGEMLVVLPALGNAQAIASDNVTIAAFAVSGQPEKTRLGHVGHRDGDADVVRPRAEAMARKAAVLRQNYTTKELNAAVALFEESARLFQAGRFYPQAADAYIQIGEIYFIESKYPKALVSYSLALKLAGRDPNQRCQVLSHMARTYANSGRNSEADSYSKQALSLSEQLASPRIQAEALEARGETLYWSSDSVHAVEPLTRARDLFAEANDDDGEALALLMLAESRFSIGEQAEGSRLAGQALQLWNSIGNSYGLARARTMLAVFGSMTGQLDAALCGARGALTAFKKVGDKDNVAIVLTTLGYTSRAMGDSEASLEYYRQTRAAFASLQDRLGEANVITAMANALKDLRRYDELPALYAAKLRLGILARNRVVVASAWADMAAVYELKHQYGNAETLYRQALRTFREVQNPYREGDILISLAGIASERGQYAQALSLLQQALAVKGPAAQVADVARIQYEMAYIHRRLNRLEDARAAIEKTVEIIESQRLKIENFDSRASYFASVHRYYALYIQILMLMHAKAPEKGLMQLALEAAERSKVRALLDLLRASEPGISCDRILQQQLSPAAATEPRPEDVASSASAPPALTWQQMQSEIEDDDTVMLEYALGDEKSYVWVVDRKQIVAHELPSADRVRKLAALVRDALIARQHRSRVDEYRERVRKADLAYRADAKRLSQALLGPLALGHIKRLLIVPDGALQYIPFSALPLPDAEDNNAVLVSRHEVVILPSASALAASRRLPRAAPSSFAVVLADPVFGREDPRVAPARTSRKGESRRPLAALTIARRGTRKLRDIESLPGTRQEAKAIRLALEGHDVLVIQGFDATRDYVVNGALNGYRIIHFATHGIIDARHPEMSGLVLSLVNRKGEQEDGYLQLGDIYKLKLSADLVVLSACDSALGKDLESEGIIGLPRGFLQAGAKTVIASLWKVEDEATAGFMKGFYERIQRGENPSSALRGAQLEMSRGQDWRQPFYWAAFVLQGDYK